MYGDPSKAHIPASWLILPLVRPREPKALFCCGEMHKSGNKHRLMVHQQHTTIAFREHPEAAFTIKRNSQTKQFHCPKCDKTTPMASILRVGTQRIVMIALLNRHRRITSSMRAQGTRSIGASRKSRSRRILGHRQAKARVWMYRRQTRLTTIPRRLLQ